MHCWDDLTLNKKQRANADQYQAWQRTVGSLARTGETLQSVIWLGKESKRNFAWLTLPQIFAFVKRSSIASLLYRNKVPLVTIGLDIGDDDEKALIRRQITKKLFEKVRHERDGEA
jgi:hypothetical protein